MEPYKIAYKRTAEDESFVGIYNMSDKPPTAICCKDLKINDYVACRYGLQWWIGLVQQVDQEEEDVKICFIHPPGPAASFIWPIRNDSCLIPITDVILKVDTPNTITGQTYTIKNDEMKKINEAFLNSYSFD